jgi:LPXTG-motif cell wall-anchored protein
LFRFEQAEEKFRQGTLGLIDWMLAKDNLTEDQTKDLTEARKILTDASEEDFSEWAGGDNTSLPEERNGKVVVIGDEKDATNLDNLLRAIETMKKINELRASDENFSGDLQTDPSYTNFYFTAVAEAGAMRGAGLRRHSLLITSCENLCFGFSDPTVGWYNQEKAVFDRIRKELGIEKLTMGEVARIEEEAERQGDEVGHYTNLFCAVDQVMGVGYTRYSRTYCYNASGASNYRDINYHVYTVAEFEKLVREYYSSVDKTALEEAYEKAAAAQSEAEKKLQDLRDGKEAAIEEAAKEAEEELAARKTDAEAASRALTKAQEDSAAARKDLEDAQTRKNAADQAAKKAKQALDQADTECNAADKALALAQEAVNEARAAEEEAESALRTAAASRESASAALEEKKAEAKEAKKALEEAESSLQAARKKLEDLTSDDTLDALREQKDQADAALRRALEDQTAGDEALAQAQEALAKADAEASEAGDALQKAKERLTQAGLEKERLEKQIRSDEEELEDLRSQYAVVADAKAERDAAREQAGAAEAALKDAESELAGAQADLTQARLTKEGAADKLARARDLSVEGALESPIEDPDFEYLNEYISAIRSADAVLAAAETALDDAERELAGRKSDLEDAQDAYTAALADLAIAKDREKAASSKSGMDHGPQPSVKAAGYQRRTAHPATGDSSNVMKLMAEFITSAGLMSFFFRKRKKETQEYR